MTHVLSSEMGMEAQRLMQRYESADGLTFQVCWWVLRVSKDTEGHLKPMLEEEPGLVQKLLQKNLQS